jgi:hypothetical protein
MTEAASAAQKHFFAPSWRTLLPPLALVLFAALPILLLRWTLYALLAAPLTPIIQRMGWVYRDKPMFLTAPAALFAAVVWAILLYFFLCTFRYLLRRRARSH